MKNINYILLLLIILSVIFITACGGSKSDDFEAPQISDVRINVDDTIHVYTEGIKEPEILLLNDSLKDSLLPDTVVIGKPLRFNAVFTDDVGMSNAVVRIWGDTLLEANLSDTCYRLKKHRLSDLLLFGKTRVEGRRILLDETVPRELRSKDTSRENRDLKVRLGDEYFFNVRCSDIAGNETSLVFGNEKIIILDRNAVIEARKNKN